ncbi:hypothetical protein RND71_042424 [Anisodus tanguticus]|uniref:Uncharacterized protein n=1 Tax=Anisodus tanguticus TaxID=243964 RepID=A0AAE1QTP0_9SOLA|nr:hypothetical protein RND71_042424 [Anisodus tanguticus]
MRHELVDWIVEIVDSHKLLPDTLYLAVKSRRGQPAFEKEAEEDNQLLKKKQRTKQLFEKFTLQPTVPPWNPALQKCSEYRVADLRICVSFLQDLRIYVVGLSLIFGRYVGCGGRHDGTIYGVENNTADDGRADGTTWGEPTMGAGVAVAVAFKFGVMSPISVRMTRKAIARESDGDINSCQEDIIKEDTWKAAEQKGQKKKETTSKKNYNKDKNFENIRQS